MINRNLISNKQKTTKIRSALSLISIVFIFVTVFFVNEKTVIEIEKSSQSRNREIASAYTLNRFEQDLSWQKKLASRISESSDVPEGKSARAPNSIEKFLFGELKGYYLMGLEDEKIREMILKQKEAEDAPRYLGTEISFLEKNKNMWWIDFSDSEFRLRTRSKSVVSLLDSSKKIVGEASFSWDSSGRLLSLKIEKQ